MCVCGGGLDWCVCVGGRLVGVCVVVVGGVDWWVCGVDWWVCGGRLVGVWG